MSGAPVRPPRAWRWILRLLLPRELRDQVLADTDDRYAAIHRSSGQREADRWLRRQLRGSLRPAVDARLSSRFPTGSRPLDLPAKGLSAMSWLLLDLRFGCRWMRRNPGVTGTVLATLALGIGASTVIFSVVYGVLLAPLPYPNAERVVRVYNTDPETRQGRQSLSLVEAVEYGAANTALEELLPFDAYPVTLQGPEDSVRVRATFAAAGFFRVFGTPPLLGRTFLPQEELPGSDDVVVLSAGLWRRVYGGERGILGRRITVEGVPRTVVGVMPAAFDFYPGSELWVPLALDRATLLDEQVLSHGTPALGLLREGTTADGVLPELDALARGVLSEYPEHQDPHAIRLEGLHEWLTGASRPALVALLVAVVFLLLVAAANVASLLLARAEKRRAELAVRAALGAGRGRLVRQMLIESLLLSGFGGLLGVAVAFALRGVVVGMLAGVVPRAESIAINVPVLAFASGLTLLTGLAFGLVPALQSGRTAAALRDAGRAATGGRRRFRAGLVVVESAVVVALLLGATLMTRSLSGLTAVDSGLGEDALTFEISLPESAYGGPAEVRGLFETLVERLERLPGVQAVGAVSWLPFARTPSDWPVTVEGRELPEGLRGPDYGFIVGDYAEAAGIDLLRGRMPEASDAGFEAVITRSMADEFFSGQDPIGRRFRQATSDRWLTVVGIVEDHRLRSLSEEPRPGFYFRHHRLDYGSGWFPRSMGVVLRTQGDPLALAPLVRDQVRSLDPALPVERLQSLREIVRATVATPRFTTLVMGAFATLGLFLGALGVFGVVSYSVAERTREIGIRMALGADRGRVMLGVLISGLAPVLAGALAGLGAGVLLARRLLQDLLWEVSAADPESGALVVAVLLAVALVAAGAPARQATRVDPVTALRD